MSFTEGAANTFPSLPKEKNELAEELRNAAGLRPPSRQKTPPKFILGDSNGLDLPSTPRTPPEIDMNIEHFQKGDHTSPRIARNLYKTGAPEGKSKEVWRSLERLSSDSSLSAVSDPAKSLSVGEDEMALNESGGKTNQEG